MRLFRTSHNAPLPPLRVEGFHLRMLSLLARFACFHPLLASVELPSRQGACWSAPQLWLQLRSSKCSRAGRPTPMRIAYTRAETWLRSPFRRWAAWRCGAALKKGHRRRSTTPVPTFARDVATCRRSELLMREPPCHPSRAPLRQAQERASSGLRPAGLARRRVPDAGRRRAGAGPGIERAARCALERRRRPDSWRQLPWGVADLTTGQAMPMPGCSPPPATPPLPFRPPRSAAVQHHARGGVPDGRRLAGTSAANACGLSRTHHDSLPAAPCALQPE